MGDDALSTVQQGETAMASSQGYIQLKGSEHQHPAGHKSVNPSVDHEMVTVTMIVRRKPGGRKMRSLDDFSAMRGAARATSTHASFAGDHGADPKELEQVAAFARSHGLTVAETDPGRRSVVVTGPVSAMNRAFDVTLRNYDSPRGKYRGYEGEAGLPHALANIVEAVSGLDNRQVPARHYSARHRPAAALDPPNTKPLMPAQVAQLYSFPAGKGANQTIGIYEMQTSEGSAGYTAQDLALTVQAMGGSLTAPTPMDVAVDGVGNAGVSDGETVLDITVSSAIAQGAKIAVYFTGGTTQNILHTLQRMIHPGSGDPVPTVISISYGWGADDENLDSFSSSEYTQIDQLFQDAANLGITVLVSSGDSGAFIETKKQAQASFPASDPWVLACGGTTIGNVNGSSFTEYVWNDTWQGGSGATGGGISARYPVPSYQGKVELPKRIGTGAEGRGLPDIAGNASVNSGYPLYLAGQSSGPIGGTSAVAPLYAGLVAVINENLGFTAGFINPTLYGMPANAFNDVFGPPGPANNSYDGTTGYPASKEWNACTGLGSINGTALQSALQAAHAVS
jgi:kumamolisin